MPYEYTVWQTKDLPQAPPLPQAGVAPARLCTKDVHDPATTGAFWNCSLALPCSSASLCPLPGPRLLDLPRNGLCRFSSVFSLLFLLPSPPAVSFKSNADINPLSFSRQDSPPSLLGSHGILPVLLGRLFWWCCTWCLPTDWVVTGDTVCPSHSWTPKAWPNARHIEDA